MSNFAQQEKYANSLALWFCDDCQEKALVQAWREMRERTSLVSAFAIVGTALDILNSGGVKPCLADCANSGAMVTTRKIAEQVFRPVPECGHILCDRSESCLFTEECTCPDAFASKYCPAHGTEQIEDLDDPEQHSYQADNYADWSEEICSRCGDMRYAHKK